MALDQENGDVHTKSIGLLRWDCLNFSHIIWQSIYHNTRGRFANILFHRNLLTTHDIDPRYCEPECRARVANLYLPLIGSAFFLLKPSSSTFHSLDYLLQVWSWTPSGPSMGQQSWPAATTWPPRSSTRSPLSRSPAAPCSAPWRTCRRAVKSGDLQSQVCHRCIWLNFVQYCIAIVVTYHLVNIDILNFRTTQETCLQLSCGLWRMLTTLCSRTGKNILFVIQTYNKHDKLSTLLETQILQVGRAEHGETSLPLRSSQDHSHYLPVQGKLVTKNERSLYLFSIEKT